MNQRQWIPVSESSSDNLNKIRKVNAAIVIALTFVSLLIGVATSQVFPVVVVGLGVSIVFVFAVMRSVETSWLQRIDYQPVDEELHARIVNVVDGLCVVSGDRRPRLFVFHDEYPVALAIAAPGKLGNIVVSDGLLEELDRVEIESVMAHVLWRLRTENIALTCYLLTLSALLGKIGLGKLGSLVTAKMTEQKILLWADISACQATRYPPALISALHKCDRPHRLSIDSQCGPLLFVDPRTVGDDTTVTSSFPILGFSAVSLEERIAVLKEM